MDARVTLARDRASEASEEGKSDRVACVGQLVTLPRCTAVEKGPMESETCSIYSSFYHCTHKMTYDALSGYHPKRPVEPAINSPPTPLFP